MNKTTNNQTTKPAARKTRARKPAATKPAANIAVGLTAKEQARAASQVAASVSMLSGFRNLMSKGSKHAGYKNLGLEIYQAAYTIGVLTHLGMLDYKEGANSANKGKATRDRATLRGFLGNTASGYIISQSWVKADDKGQYAVTVDGLNIFNARIQGQSPRQAFNTNPDAIKAVLGWIRNGKGDKAVSFIPEAYSVKA